jgi:ElaB/YqjD/DUF883 family membrane-anchored ribosome-binding protein
VDDAEDPAEREIAASRAEIEQTRAEMSETIDAIKEKLSPHHLVEQAKETVREATVGRAQEAVSNVVDTAREAVSNAGETVRDTSSTVWQTIERNPIPSALIAMGAGWLFMNLRRQRDEERRSGNGYSRGYSDRNGPRYGASTTGAHAEPGYPQTGYSSGYPGTRRDYPEMRESGPGPIGRAVDRVQDRAGEVVDRVQETAGELSERVQERAGEIAGSVRAKAGEVTERLQDKASELSAQARYGAARAEDQYQRLMRDNPVAVGVAALALGAVAGLVLPETRWENERLGGARDQLVERAQETARDLGQKAQQVAQRVVETAKDEAKDQGLLQQAQGVAHEAMDAGRAEASRPGMTG